MRRNCLLIAASFFALSLAWAPRSAHAFEFYIETGFGGSQIRNGSTLFGGGPDSLTFGLALNTLVAMNLMEQTESFQVHIGVAWRYASGSDAIGYAFQTISPVFKFEFPRFYLGFGMSPFVMHSGQTGSTFNILGMESASGLGLLGMAGFLWRVVPYFHVALEGAVQIVRFGSAFSPQPSLEFTLQTRFYLSTPTKDPSAAAPRNFDGWRYPFGIGK